MDGRTLRDGIFGLNTRRFGDVTDILVRRLVGLRQAEGLSHDLFDDTQSKRVEVKFSRVLKKSRVPVTDQTVLECIEGATSEHRMVNSRDWQRTEFDCNIQQIKRDEFDVLYYGLFFADTVLIFRIASHEIGPDIQYSDWQHRGNVGEGQFHINRRTMQTHLDRHLHTQLSYDELLALLSP